MPEPEESQVDCIGCGTMNPASAEVCSGCGHRFAGPTGRVAHEPGAAKAEGPREPVLDSLTGYRAPDQPTAMGCLAKGIAITLTILATLIAFVIAFFATCSALWNQDSGIAWSFAAGLGAASAVVIVAVGIRRITRSNREAHDKINWRG
jgi:hypothetical protein